MEIATIKVNTVTACVECKNPIPRGLVGGSVSIHYADPLWKDLNKTVVFQGAVTRDVLNVTDTVEIPWETVAEAGITLYIGLYGSNADGSIVIPTIWTELGMIQGAANPSGDLSAAPTLNVWEQIQATVGNLGKLETQNKASIVDAVNEVFSVGGTGPAAVKSVNGLFPDETGNVEVGDGFSPTVTLTDIDGGVRVGVTDINGTTNTDITAAKIGAAPAGFGLGDDAQRIDSWNNATRNGFYISYYGSPDGDGNEWHGIVVNYTKWLCNQLVWKSWGTGSIMATRRVHEGVLEEWEWINPPMAPGVEYRTTERWNGKVVYTKMMLCGAMVDKGRFPTGMQGIYRHCAFLYNPETAMPLNALPYVEEAGNVGDYDSWVSIGTAGDIIYHCNSGGSGAYVGVRMWYIK